MTTLSEKFAWNIATDADRALTDAAPELLEALRDISKQCANAAKLGATGPGFYEDIDDTARAAIAKAEGR